VTDFGTLDLDVFLSDFAISVNASTWGLATMGAIFDIGYVELEDISRESPFLVVRASDVPSDADTGDLFTISATVYKLVDLQDAETGMKRIILAAT